MHMNPEILTELKFFGISFATGAGIVFAYDGLRIFRCFFKHGTFWYSLEDLCFWMSAGFVLFLVMERYYNGVLRGFSLFGALFGMLVYREAVSPAVMGVCISVLEFFRAIIKRILRICAGIGKWVFQVVMIPVRFVGKGAETIGGAVRYMGRKMRKKISKKFSKNN